MINFVGGVIFFTTFEGKFALISMIGAMVIMTFIYAKHGFVRLLGLGHILFWLPFMYFCLIQIKNWSLLDSAFRLWLLVVTLFNGVSLVLDFVDVFRFLKGEKEEIV